MATWNDYKNHVRESNPEIGKDIDEIEERAKIVSAMIAQRHNQGLTQRDLAEMCGLPHSSVARIESGKTSPNLTTLLKIFNKLGLSLTVHYVPQNDSVKAASDDDVLAASAKLMKRNKHVYEELAK